MKVELAVLRSVSSLGLDTPDISMVTAESTEHEVSVSFQLLSFTIAKNEIGVHRQYLELFND